MAPFFNTTYPRYLQEAVDHAGRLIETLNALEPRSARRSAELWLVGRVEEIECLVGTVLREWRTGLVDVAEAARIINAYLHGLHRGLAMHFGELAPSCCVYSLVVTAAPASYVSVTSSFPPSTRAKTVELGSTWGEVEDAELLDLSVAPSSP
jgi:hypothetical protein